ncbi:MAG: hypothetical protein K2W97_08270 [Chthoniobacterales bacterium]|nr:hypothetical protein [Chthoniobacterales bacterium]
MLKAFSLFLFFLLLFSPLISFAAEQASPLPGTLTVQKYTEFLQATAATDSYSLYNEKMGATLSPCIIREGEPDSYSYQAIPEHADDPVPYVSRLSAKRYCNWLQNGKPKGEQHETTTERGAYILDGTIEGDPERQETATYFLPASTNNEVDPTLASNLKTYVITTHLGDSFRFSNSSSEDETTAWTVGGVIAGVAGLAAVLHYRRGMCRDDRNADPAHRTTAEVRREEETREINAEQRGENASSSINERSSISATDYHLPLKKKTNQRQAGRVSFNEAVTLCEGAVKTTPLSDKPSTLHSSGRLEDDDPRRHQWGPRLRENVLPLLSREWLEQNPSNPFFITLHNKLLSPKTTMTWNSQEAWHAWHEEFKKSPALVQEVITKKTDLLNDWENWREYSYGPHPRRLEVSQKEAADIWKAQVEATLNELNELLQTAKKIQEGEHEIMSALHLKETFTILFETIFSHLHRIDTNIEDAMLGMTLFNWESLMKAQLAEWSERLNDGSIALDFVPSDFKTQIETAICAAQILNNLVDKHQDQALRLRQIAEEEKNQQQRTTEASELDRSSFGSTDTGKTDHEEITPVHGNKRKDCHLTSPL